MMVNNITLTGEHVIRTSVLKVGRVVEVSGRTVKVNVDTGKNTASILHNGGLIQNISVGGYVKVKKGLEEMIGKIDSESVSEDLERARAIYSSPREIVSRVINIKILGYFDNEGVFKRGIKELPLVDNGCYLLTGKEFNKIHNFIRSGDEPIRVGSLEYGDDQGIEIGVNGLFASHIGIFGNTGSGKSYTLAQLHKRLFEKYETNEGFLKKAQFLFLDFNGEYVGDNVMVDKTLKRIYELSTRREVDAIGKSKKFPIHEGSINDSAFWSIFLEATEKTQTPFLNRALGDSRLSKDLSSDQEFVIWLQTKILEAAATKGKNVGQSLITDLLYEIGNYLNNGSIRGVATYFRKNLLGCTESINCFIQENGEKYFSGQPEFLNRVENQVQTIKDINLKKSSYIKKLGLKVIMKYYDEIIRGFMNKEHLSPLLKRLEKRVDDLDKVLIVVDGNSNPEENIIIVSLRNVNLAIRKILPMLLVREMYDKKKNTNDKGRSLHIVIDEAHNILSDQSERESMQWKDYRLEMFEEIIKEGRKFSTFLTVASQRPSDISSTIISQLHNYFIHRLINNNDLLAVERTIAYLDKVSADSIPNLPTGVCIMAGLVAQMPVVVKIDKIDDLERQPQSQDIELTQQWVPDYPIVKPRSS